MEIGGMHGIDQSLDYTINMQIPRAMFGTGANNALNELVSKASATGLPIRLSDQVNVGVKMGGTIMSPTIQLDLKETAGNLAEELKDQLKEFAQAKVDSARKAVTDTLQSLRKEAVRSATEALKDELFKRRDSAVVADSAKKSPADRARESARGLIKSIIPKKPADSTRKE